MSHIFDALQRSESEQSGEDFPVPSQATEMLQNAEHRATSNWASAALLDLPQKANNSKASSPGQLPEAHLNAAPGDIPTAVERTAIDVDLNIFEQVQTLHASPSQASRLICLTDPESPAAESFRLLGVRLRHLRRDRPLKKVLITSTIPNEGKSMVSANLACALAAKTKQRTLLLEGDLRRSCVSQLFGLTSSPGVCECLEGQRSLAQSFYFVEGSSLWIMPAGSNPSNALELLQSDILSALMAQLSTLFEWIIIDSPPVLPLADTSIWTRYADGVLLVTCQGITEKRQLQRGLEAIDPKKLIGALVNRSNTIPHSDYYYRLPPASRPSADPPR